MSEKTTERVRLLTQRVLGHQRPGWGIVGKLIRIAEARERALSRLLECSQLTTLACPSCGEVWQEETGPSGYRLCKTCVAVEEDPWDTIPEPPRKEPT